MPDQVGHDAPLPRVVRLQRLREHEERALEDKGGGLGVAPSRGFRLRRHPLRLRRGPYEETEFSCGPKGAYGCFRLMTLP